MMRAQAAGFESCRLKGSIEATWSSGQMSNSAGIPLSVMSTPNPPGTLGTALPARAEPGSISGIPESD